MKPKRTKPYNPELELAKGATLDAASYDKTQKIKVTVGKVTVGGIAGRAEIVTSHLMEAASVPRNRGRFSESFLL
ncbi:MAG: hypothetical protein ACYC2I_08895 [Elusimicrobiales bacterium]